MKTSALISTLVLQSAALLAQKSEQPNILFIMTDQQNFNMMSCMGNTFLQTPAMDAIAANGYMFEQTYCVNPVSVPSRFSLMTGRYASEIGSKSNLRKIDKAKLAEITPNALGNVFSRAGYETVYAGKTHLYTNAKDKDYGFDIRTINPYEEAAVEAERFFTERKEGDSDKPFFLFLSFLNPHDICYDAGMDPRYPERLKPDYVAATKHFLEYKEQLSPAEYAAQIPPAMPYLEPIAGDENNPALLPAGWIKGKGNGYLSWTTEQQDLYRWMYYRLTESVDALIGRSLAALEASGEADNTIIVFTSDHGELLGAYGLVSKSAMVDACQRVPFIFAGKGIRAGKVDKKTLACNGLDLLPTLCDLADIERPEGLTGVSLKPYITGKGKAEQRKYIFTENYNGYQVTDGRYKLSVYEYENHPFLMTDLKKDPNETRNIYADKAYQKERQKLEAVLMAHLKERGLLPLAVNKKP